MMRKDKIFDRNQYSEQQLYQMHKPKTVLMRQAESRLRTEHPDCYAALTHGERDQAFMLLCQYMDIDVSGNRFVYSIDFDMPYTAQIGNITPDYGKIIRGGLNNLKYLDYEMTNSFCESYNSAIDGLSVVLDRTIDELDFVKPSHYEIKKQWFVNMKNKPAEHFEEALQRILFLNQMLWQTGARLIGLGHLDILLWDLYEMDENRGILSREEAKDILCEFFSVLHRDYWYKSNMLLGDTGQIIAIGGVMADGTYVCNELTELFLETAKDLKQTEPKINLRVSVKMPKQLLLDAVECMATGIGSPLLSNDDVIIAKLVDFGVEEADAYEYATSACWEPLICGKDSSQNNYGNVSYVRALHNLMLEENLSKYHDFENMVNDYLQYIKYEVNLCLKKLDTMTMGTNALYSVYMDGCKEAKKDISDGGAKYHNVGITTSGLGNVVNSLLVMKKLVFDEKKYTLCDMKKALIFDFEGCEDLLAAINAGKPGWGSDNSQAIELTNKIIKNTTAYTKDYRTRTGGKLKFGVSSPSHIIKGTDAMATPDGRKSGESFIVHISSEKADAYTEVIKFAAALDYGENRFNGNVVDLVASSHFMKSNADKLTDMLLIGIKLGFFQLQINVVDSATLLEARANPEKYTNLVVRVWGFSAYFVELPDEYQNLIIQRARVNEGIG